VGLALVGVLVVLFVLFYWGVFGGGAAGGRPGYPPWGGFFLLFGLVLLSLFVIRIALWSGRHRYYGYGRPGGRHGDPAVMIARQRYARGEITREQYDQILTDLDRRGRGPGGPLTGS